MSVKYDKIYPRGQEGLLVSPAPSPSVRRRRLGAELRRLREAAGLTGDQVVERIGWASASKVSRIENGRSRPSLPDVRALLGLYQVTGRRRDQLMAIARDAGNTRGWLRAYPVMTPRQRGYAELEASCSEIREYGQLVVPGLLQAPEYARWRILGAQALSPVPAQAPRAGERPMGDRGATAGGKAAAGGRRSAAGGPAAGAAAGGPAAAAAPFRASGDIDTEVAARTARQGLLLRDDPPRYDAVLEESAFTGRAGPPDVLADQLEHLCRLASLPHVTLRLLPPQAVIGDWYVPATSFSIYQFTDPEDPGTVAIEALVHDVLLSDNASLRQYLRVFDWLREAARPPEESRRWLAEAAAAARRAAGPPTRQGGDTTAASAAPLVPGGDPAVRPAAPPTQRGPRQRRVKPYA